MTWLRAIAARIRSRWRRCHPWLHPVFCSWCQLYRPGQEPNVTAWSTVEHSSGLCPECKLRVLAESAEDLARSEGRTR